MNLIGVLCCIIKDWEISFVEWFVNILLLSQISEFWSASSVILIFSDIMYEIRLKSLVTKTKLCFIIFEDNQISKIAYNKKANHHDELKIYFFMGAWVLISDNAYQVAID